MYEFDSIRLLFPIRCVFLWIYSAFDDRGAIFSSSGSTASVKFIYLAIEVPRAFSVDLFFRRRIVVRSKSAYFIVPFSALH